jgi:hypothetical protein
MKFSRKRLHRTIEIEPLSDARWARIERNLLEQTLGAEETGDRRVSKWPRGALREAMPGGWRLAGALFVLVGAFAAISGVAAWRYFLPDSHQGMTRVETAANGSRVEFGESTIDVGPASAVRLAGDDSHGVIVTLDRGRVECDVSPRRERPPFVVEAGGVDVRVIGTHFVVTRTADAVTVDVQRGTVEVTSDGQRSLVSAGAHWPLSPEVAAVTTPAPPSPDADHGVAEARATGSGAIHAPGSLLPHDQYDAASKLEARQPAAAMAIYRELARQGGAWGQNALFAEGRLQADRGDANEARHLLRDYLARYPGGPNADDARRLLDRLR